MNIFAFLSLSGYASLLTAFQRFAKDTDEKGGDAEEEVKGEDPVGEFDPKEAAALLSRPLRSYQAQPLFFR